MPDGTARAVPYFLWALNSLVGIERIFADLDVLVTELGG